MVLTLWRSSSTRLRSNQGLKNLIHLPAGGENKVAAVFDLIIGILIMEPAAFLLFQIKGETQAAAINPTLADRLQSPYSLLSRQGICDLSQAHGVGDLSKTVALLGKADSGFSGLAGDVLYPSDDAHG